MKAGEEKLMDVIKREVQFKIPIYQRFYDWQNGHCQALVNDILRLLKNPEIPIHFIGSIVYIDESGQYRIGSTRELLVIDGQQRLTTFTLIFLILEELAKSQTNTELMRKIRNSSIINEYSKPEHRNKLVLTKSDNEILEKLIRGDDVSDIGNSNLVGQYHFLKTKIQEIIKDFPVETIYENLNRIMIVDVCLSHDQDNPQQIFESLNTTGKSLTHVDKIRNFILMNLPHESQNKIYESYWCTIESSFKDVYETGCRESELISFFTNYLYMMKGASTNIDDMYEEFKRYSHDNKSYNCIEKMASDILKYAKYYLVISKKDDDNPEVNNTLNDLKKLGSVNSRFHSHYPLLLRIYNEYKESRLKPDEFIDIIRAIESFLLRRNICGIPTNSLNLIFRTIWKKLDKNNLKESLIKTLKSGTGNQHWPDDSEFKEALRLENLAHLKIVKLLLEELEKYENKEANKDFASLSLEHILPQKDAEKLSDNWKNMLGPQYKKIRDNWVHRLGNLTLTGYNSEYSDKSFDEKKTMEHGFIESGLRLNKQIAEYPVWNEVSIEDRADKLAKLAIKRWSFFGEISPTAEYPLFEDGKEMSLETIVAEEEKEKLKSDEERLIEVEATLPPELLKNDKWIAQTVEEKIKVLKEEKLW